MDPFTLSDHLVDDHDLSALTVDAVDSDQLRQVHRGLHRTFAWAHGHDDD